MGDQVAQGHDGVDELVGIEGQRPDFGCEVLVKFFCCPLLPLVSERDVAFEGIEDSSDLLQCQVGR